MFRASVGRLNWIAFKTRPDIVFAVHECSTKTVNPLWEDVVKLNKVVRLARFNRSVGIKMLPMGKTCRIVAMTDASFNRALVCPSYYSGLFFVSDYLVDYDQNLYISDPVGKTDLSNVNLFKGSLIYWRSKVVKRRVDTIMDVETLSIQYGSVVGQYLTDFLVELQLTARRLKPVIFNDNQSTVNHIKSTNKHQNVRLNVIWSTLRQAFTRNQFALSHTCGKSLNLSDVLTKSKTSISALFLKALRLGKIYLPRK